MRLKQAMLYVKDLSGMATFYGQVLGLRRVGDEGVSGWVEFEAGGITLALHAIPDHIAKQIETAVPARPREMNPLKLVFAVDDLAAELTRLTALGVTIAQRPWGTHYLVDPEGNIFQICAR